MAYELTEQKKVGLGLIGFGIFFSFLAVILFFDRGLLALGNIFWLTGVGILLGWHSTWNLFTSKENYKGTASFLLGLFFLFVRWPIVGIVLETYGCIALFGGFWPTVKMFLCQIPVIGWIIQYPILEPGVYNTLTWIVPGHCSSTWHDLSEGVTNTRLFFLVGYKVVLHEYRVAADF